MWWFREIISHAYDFNDMISYTLKSWCDFIYEIWLTLISALQSVPTFLMRKFMSPSRTWMELNLWSCVSTFWMKRSKKISAGRRLFGSWKLFWGAERPSSPKSAVSLALLYVTIRDYSASKSTARKVKVITNRHAKCILSTRTAGEQFIAIARSRLRTRSRAAPVRVRGVAEEKVDASALGCS